MDGVRIWRLVDRPSTAAGVADLLKATWPDYYGDGKGGCATTDVSARMRASGRPLGFVACDRADRVFGSVALAGKSFGSAGEEADWLIGLCVSETARGKGIGSSLVKATESAARQEGTRTIYATTRSAAGLLTRLGWESMRVVSDGQHDWQVMCRHL